MSNSTKFFFPIGGEGLDSKTADVLQRLVAEIDRSIRAITPEAISGSRVSVVGGSGSGGGAVSSSKIRQGEISVTGAGVLTISFADVGVATYQPQVDAFSQSSEGYEKQLVLPLLPPYTSGDSRTTNSFQVQYFTDCTIRYLLAV